MEKKVKKIAILSGKGGTGKTTVAAALSQLMDNKTIADCDVDAADLYILLNPKEISSHKFYGGNKAEIIADKCVKCGLCQKYCRFNAIEDYQVNPLACEGCGFCYHICDFDAVKFEPAVSGIIYRSKVETNEDFFYASLMPGEGNSGKLVTEIKKLAEESSRSNDRDFILIDGPPGIGCPVNAAVADVDLVVIVAEPTKSGVHDLKRLIELLKNFRIITSLIINKFDLNLELTSYIQQYAKAENITIIGKLPYDYQIVQALQKRTNLLDYSDITKTKFEEIKERILELVEMEKVL